MDFVFKELTIFTKKYVFSYSQNKVEKRLL